MLSDFIFFHRAEILALTREKVAVRMAPRASDAELRVRNLPEKGCIFWLELPLGPNER